MRTFVAAVASGLLGVLLLMASLGTSGAVYAAPLLNITGVPTEPPTSVPTTPPTSVPPVNNATTPTPAPSATPAVVSGTDVPTTPGQTTDRPERHAHLTIRKIADQATAQVGDVIGFSIVVGNTGDATAHDVVVTDELPGYLKLTDFSSTQGTTSINGQALTARIGDVPPEGTVLLRVRAYVLESAPDTASNTAILNTGTSSTATFIVIRPSPTPLPPTAQATPVPPPATAQPPTVAPPPATAVPPRPAPPRPARLPVTAEDPTAIAPDQLLAGSLLGISALMLGLWLRRRRAN